MKWPEIPKGISTKLQTVGASTLQRYTPKRETLKDDAVAGVVGAVSSVPDGMASSVLAGVNPIYGLYASMVGRIAGGLFASTHLLVVTTTSAAALAAAGALSGLEGDERDQALFLLTLIAGVVMIGAGLLKLGSLTRFVSHSVMTGFLIGISLLIALGQIGDFVGYDPPRSNKVAKTIYVATHPGQIEPSALTVGVLAMVLAILLPRTPLRQFGTIVALIVPSLVAALPAWDSVQIVGDVGAIPGGLPLPDIPSFSTLSFDLLTGALAVAIISLIQGAGVAQNFPNPPGQRASVSGDFTAQGIANVACGVFQGQPVGGSVGGTALNVSAKGRSRWASIFSGVWLALILLLFAGLVGRVATPALAALLILAGLGALNIREGITVWRTGWAPRIAGVTTLVATLFLPIQWAVAIGAVLSATIHLFTASVDVSLVRLVRNPEGRIAEEAPPTHLPSHEVIVLDVHGSLFYAGAWTLGRALPVVETSDAPAVVLRLRNRTAVGATFIDILGRYADQIRAAGGRLFLVGVDSHVAEQMRRTGKLGADNVVTIYPATPVLLESTAQAIAGAQAWLATPPPSPATAGSATETPVAARAADADGAGVPPTIPDNERP